MLAAGVPVAEILPGEGVVLEGGEVIRARAVVSNADPKVTAGLLGAAIEPDFATRVGVVADDEPGRQGQLRPVAAAALDGRPRRRLAEPGAGVDRVADGRRPAAFEACTRGVAVAGLRRAVLPDGVRPDGGAARQAHDVGVRAVRAVRPGRGHVGRAAGRDRPADPRADRPVLRRRRRRRAHRGARARRTSRPASGSPAGTSSRASARPTRCGGGGCPRARREAASTCAARRPTRRAA